MIIDFHTHTFPDELADRAVGTLAHSGGIHNYLVLAFEMLLLNLPDRKIKPSNWLTLR